MRRNRRLLFCSFVAAAALGGCIHTEPFRDARGGVLPGSIAAMEKVRLGGVSQRVWFRGERTSNPALILLHGGPGASESPLFRHYDADLEKSFLIVYWDQRGAGRSYHGGISPESMTIPQFLSEMPLADVLEPRSDDAPRLPRAGLLPPRPLR